ncbi:hypothetical protein HMPREF1505_0200 [Prevotella sp. ICM33]|nr:hypothetical protein HMPREF1505_0200 [Prevotella sp. ICM33]
MSISSDMLGKELFFANIQYSCELRKRKLLSFEHRALNFMICV